MIKEKIFRKKIVTILAILGILILGGVSYLVGFSNGQAIAPQSLVAGATQEQLSGSIIGIDSDKVKIKDHDKETEITISTDTKILGRETKLRLNQSVIIRAAKVSGKYIAIQVRIR